MYICAEYTPIHTMHVTCDSTHTRTPLHTHAHLQRARLNKHTCKSLLNRFLSCISTDNIIRPRVLVFACVVHFCKAPQICILLAGCPFASAVDNNRVCKTLKSNHTHAYTCVPAQFVYRAHTKNTKKKNVHMYTHAYVYTNINIYIYIDIHMYI